jgi:dihydrodipicolinate synthase/N-acetylneuraminate lyase
MNDEIRKRLQSGGVIPACPLALTAGRKLDERRQRALIRYYSAAGAGGLAVGVHTTQFAIRDPAHGLFEPVLSLAAEEMDRADARNEAPMVRVAGICGETPQATREASLVRQSGYHAGLLSLGAMRKASEEEMIAHCRAVAEIIPVIGFYLQPAVGGRILPFSFWRRFAELENIVAIKIAPFNRYQTLDVLRAIVETGREDVALYTGNDDTIVHDLVTPFRLRMNGCEVERHFVGGLLGHWAVWTSKAVQLHRECREAAERNHVSTELLRRAWEVTDCNAAFFDAANGFAGCIAGLHEVLRRQGLFEGTWCLDPNEGLSRGQAEEIDRVYHAYPHLNDDSFVRANLDTWLR